MMLREYLRFLVHLPLYGLFVTQHRVPALSPHSALLLCLSGFGFMAQVDQCLPPPQSAWLAHWRQEPGAKATLVKFLFWLQQENERASRTHANTSRCHLSSKEEMGSEPAWDTVANAGRRDCCKQRAGAILKILQQDSNHALSKSKEAILYLFEAIMVLSDIQHNLLAYSMEKRILHQQQELVRNVLEPNFRCPWSIPFTLKPELLAPLQSEDLAITYGLLEECGLRMELDGRRSTWDLAVKMPLSALYGTLSSQQQLAEA
nr:gasdermin-C-like [Aotus nancymaae]